MVNRWETGVGLSLRTNLQEEGVKSSLDLFVCIWLVEEMIISSTKLETRGGLLRAGSVRINGVWVIVLESLLDYTIISMHRKT